eukprot:m.174012 g.174012  ORF g.174012 m.174012 type:complete len:548 (-) comp18315_c0_seq1:170-1813(-)
MELPAVEEDCEIDLNSPSFKQDIVRIIAQYLDDEGYAAARVLLLDEAGIHLDALRKEQTLVRQLRDALSEGSWETAIGLCKQLKKSDFGKVSKNDALRGIEYGIQKQHFLELLDNGEVQQAFNHLTARMKPYEKAVHEGEMRELAYALTCQSVHDVGAFRDWSVTTGRDQLVGQLNRIFVGMDVPTDTAGHRLQPARLVHLLQQAVQHQLDRLRIKDKRLLQCNSLLRDFATSVVPNAAYATLSGHGANVKCVAFDPTDPNRIISGSSDSTVRVWDLNTAREVTRLCGHTSRVWDVAPLGNGRCVSASADGTLRMWNMEGGGAAGAGQPRAHVGTMTGHTSDVYSVSVHPGRTHAVSGGYDKTVRLWDLRTSTEVRQLEGHQMGVSQTLFNAYGNFIVSASKDCTAKLWDLTSCLCVHTIASEQLTEITGADMSANGIHLLLSTRSNTNILMDVRMNRTLKRFRGHQNSTRHFVRAAFGPIEGCIVGGSEDGKVYIWDMTTGDIVQTLEGHYGSVYSTAWSEAQARLASCSDDGTVRVWEYQTPQPK